MKRIRELLASGKIVQGEALGDFQKKSGSGYEKLIAKVAAEAFDDVIPRFHIVRGATMEPKLFTFTGKIGATGNTIELTTGGRQFLINYRKLVNKSRFSWDGSVSPKTLHQRQSYMTKSAASICKGERSPNGASRSGNSRTANASTTRAM